MLREIFSNETYTKDSSIKHAINVYHAVLMQNYSSLFKLYASSPNMSGYLMDRFVFGERKTFTQSLLRTYRPTIRCTKLTSFLGFETFAECTKFLNLIGIHDSLPEVIETRQLSEHLDSI